MDFGWTREQLELRDAMRKFALKELKDDIINRDKKEEFSRDLWEKCARMGIQGLPFPEEYGGSNADILTTVLAMEGLGYGCKDAGLLFSINAQMWSIQMPILRFGSNTQKNKYLPKLCNGQWIGAHGMTEPDSGSDSFSLSTSARLDGDHYILNGTKTFVTNAPVADVFVIFATIDKRKGFMGVTGFIVEKGFYGFQISKRIEKMGLKTSPMAELIFEDCKVPVENRLGREGGGAAIFNDSMEWERSCILACNLGAMEKQLETCIKYAKERKQFNKPIGKCQSVANKLADMKVRIDTARLILYKVAWMKKTQGQAVMDAAIAKLYLSESWIKSCLDAIQIHGGYGYTAEYELERSLRDSVGGTLYSGTSEIQRNIIARHLGL
ncbi:MAG: acyl-CoA dehydrogenase [Candidatus Brocadia sp.]|nr:Flavoprotein desaturase PigA [Candidatus Brocadia fulgida]MCC6325478.1 acyl-CoA dehydrogenase family protein [Candidatus Brocadia sp.]MCE7910192.1 acyl-CoA dehydrogenase [Candidatus Brocadia sp. AMX3]OQZ03157.1 MAG: acyl-CoA dehydrogenase [Candidatus Brocadia sp. UTAMX2]MDG5996845.1 acyl-CoA dehydrogenase [Candidatus Brocadia sp.]